jgi:S-methylmethionine-dependent homocysteine/selenocysteine methylase
MWWNCVFSSRQRHPRDVGLEEWPPNDSADAIDIVKRHWNGPLGAYPDSGYFKKPEWSFVDIMSPTDLVDRAQVWQRQGVTAFGGCCGLGPEHVAALARRFRPG